MSDLEKLYTVQEVALAYGVTEETIRRWIRNKQIEYTVVGPFRLKRLKPENVIKPGANNGKGSTSAVSNTGQDSGTK